MEEKENTIEYSILHSRCVEEAKKLSDLLERIKNEEIEIKRKKDENDKYCVRIRTELDEDIARIDAEKTNLVEMKETSTKELTKLKNEVKSITKDLNWTNDKVLKARNELDLVEREKEKIVLENERMLFLLKKIPDLVGEVRKLEEKRGSLKTEISEMLESSSSELDEAKKELEKIENQVKTKIEEENQATIKRDRMVTEAVRIEKDIEIYISRVEKFYNKAFPDLRMKL